MPLRPAPCGLLVLCLGILVTDATLRSRAPEPAGFGPGARVLLDAHNAYPYQGRWADRLERALATGVPLAIEQDLVWHCGATAGCRSIVSHGEPFTGQEPTLEEHFFRRIEPVVRAALAGARRDDWPLVTLNLDFKDVGPEHLQTIWDLLGRYESWLTTAERRARADEVAPLQAGPVLVLTGVHDEQQVAFHDRVPVGQRLRLFGAVPAITVRKPERVPGGVPDALLPRLVTTGARTNYRRWWNTDWTIVEGGGQRAAGDWTTDDAARLRALAREAHAQGLWFRTYTLNGHGPGGSAGWSESYNFGSSDAVRRRWQAAIEAGVDFVATDQYEAFATLLRDTRPTRRVSHAGQPEPR